MRCGQEYFKKSSGDQKPITVGKEVDPETMSDFVENFTRKGSREMRQQLEEDVGSKGGIWFVCMFCLKMRDSEAYEHAEKNDLVGLMIQEGV